MNTPVRVTAQAIGSTAFNTKAATLEWTPEGRIRIVQVEPGEQPVVLLDTPPQSLKQVSSYTIKQSTLIFQPHAGPNVQLSMLGSVIAPDPDESADAYHRRAAMTGVPPQSWWAESLAAQGVKVAHWGWSKTLPIAGGIVAALIVFSAIAAAFS